MLSVLVEISGLHQLNKINPETGPKLLRKFQAYLGYDGFNLEFLTSHNYIYVQKDEQDSNTRQFWDGVWEIYNYLFEQRKEFQGFLILADKTKKQPSADGLSALKKKSYAIRKTDSLLLTAKAEEVCGSCFPTRREGEYFTLQAREKLNVPPGFLESKLYLREKLIEKILSCLVPALEDPASPPAEKAVLNFFGDDGVGKYSNILGAIQSLRKNAGPYALPVVSGVDGLKSSFQEILESMEPDFLRQVPVWLSENEKLSWESRMFFLSQGASEQSLEDLYIFYRLYIKSYILFCQENSFPAYVICRNPDQVSPESLKVLEKIFLEFFPGENLLPVFISRNQSPRDSWFGLPCQNIRITPLSCWEIDRILGQTDLREFTTQDVREKTGGHVLYFFHYIMLLYNSQPVPPELTEAEISYYLFRSLDSSLQKCLYTISLFPGLTDEDHWAKLFESGDVIFQSALPLIRELRTLGFLSQDRWLRPALPDIQAKVNLEAAEKNRIRDFAIRGVSGFWEEKRAFSVYSFLQGIKDNHGQADFSRQFFDYVSGLLEQGQVGKAETLIDVFSNLFSGDSSQGLEKTIVNSLALRSALIQGDREMARIRFLSFSDSAEAPFSFPEALLNLETSRYYYAFGEYRKALDAAKKALLVFQEGENPFLTSDANCQIGQIMMGMGRLNEAAMYFTLCREQLSFSLLPHNYIKTLALEGLCQYMLGNYSRSAVLLEEVCGKAAQFGRRDWESFALFLLGRKEFELGHYAEAEKLFVQGLLLGRLYFNDDRMKVLRAWIARCGVYQGQPEEALKILETLKPDAEVLFFSAEAFYFLDDQARALEALNIILDNKLSQSLDFYPGEYLYWKTGFSSAEDRAIGTADGHTVLSNMIRVFRGYLLGLGTNITEGLQELSKISREGVINEEDPYRHVYYYMYKCVVPELGDGENLNRLTILSRASKHLQYKASRIDETKDKQDFLKKNYWNRRLLEETREEKII